jgi:putative membrane protein
MHDGNWHEGMGDGAGWWWFLMVIMMIAFWGGLIWIGIAVLRHNRQAPAMTPPNVDQSGQRPSAQDILAERLARGEIEIEDYRQRLAVLREPPPN